MAEDLSEAPDYPKSQKIIRPFSQPIKPDSHLVILRGNLAPEGAVAKITGKGRLRLCRPRPRVRFRRTGPARNPGWLHPCR